MDANYSLEHHFLIAMPSLADSWFEKTVIYLVEDNEFGSMGLVINLPHKLNIQQLLEHFKMEFDPSNPRLDDVVLMGGPVDMEHGFILHYGQHEWQKTLPLKDNLSMTVSEDLLESISRNDNPKHFIACLGYAGWGKGQLQQEIQDNNWLTIPYNESLLFEVPVDTKWEVALATLGIAPEHLSVDAGHS